jgi:U3 small nucleolar RNA-associated protein 22
LNSVLSIPKSISSRYGTGEERLADCISVFEEFSKIIKNLKDLPLMINSVQGLSPTFRQTEVFASLPCCFKYDAVSEKNMYTKIGHKYVPKYPLGPVLVPYVKPLEIVCQLESSGKWPDDLECIKRLKSAFYLQILKDLRDNHGLTAFTTVNYCDCLYKGFVFRIILCTMSELLCVKSEINEHGVILTKDSKKSLAYEKDMFHIPKLNSVLHA